MLLDEIIIGGVVIETNLNDVLESYGSTNKIKKAGKK